MVYWYFAAIRKPATLAGRSSRFALGMLSPGLAVSVRRLHDAALSGWWVLINLAPVVGPLIVIVLMCIPSRKPAGWHVAASDQPGSEQPLVIDERADGRIDV